jgi:uncharacterized protein (TIGR02147 family)
MNAHQPHKNHETSCSVFDYFDYREFLLDVSARRMGKRKRSEESLAGWSKRLGYRSARSIAMVLNGMRLPSSEMCLRLGRDLNLSKEEFQYFTLLLSLARNKNGNTKPILEELERLRPKIRNEVRLSALDFTHISDWYALVLKQLISTLSFKENLKWIRNRLRNKVTEAQITRAIDTLLKNGFVERDTRGKLQVKQESVRTPTDIPQRAIRAHHKQMMLRAIEALEEQRVSEREISSITFKMDPKRLSEAKRQLCEFRDRFNKTFGGNHDSVWQLNLQLFQHTRDT